ncbi:hypothetical protein HYH03_015399 [Edaphochlamys debaryana]|uniref:Uncharacterized protein n=1 Tax=Edaphochlamys debaryana TaxID=47281 RepID=A0A835XLB9_9CHLO|nr:hypothetical protein HYH03_015399 [Edaphochlamys debaryana]|eukprot:KAG2485956.1 hypothetical protein HYH03_015399 [Edaphochlamys debaryana]
MPLEWADAWYPLALATGAGLSTTLGAVVAVVRKPSARVMAALLGVALGVMATVSVVELLARNALSGQSDGFLVCASGITGALAYYMLEPFFPKMDEHHDYVKKQDDLDDHEAFFRALTVQGGERGGPGGGGGAGGAPGAHGHGGSGGCLAGTAGGGGAAGDEASATTTATGGLLATSASGEGASQRKGTVGLLATQAAAAAGLGRKGSAAGAELLSLGSGGGGADGTGFGPGSSGPGALGDPHGGPLGAASSSAAASASASARSKAAKAARMLRLGLLMAVTMTLHNLPEGFAVAFSAFTDIGPVMALAIALHNIPEGVIVAAPIYAATGSRARAVGIATASGLSEPLGALLSLVLLRPFFSLERLHYLLAFVGGVMLAVCAIELWPEGRNCRNDRAFAAGVVGGSVVMGWTLWVEG